MTDSKPKQKNKTKKRRKKKPKFKEEHVPGDLSRNTPSLGEWHGVHEEDYSQTVPPGVTTTTDLPVLEVDWQEYWAKYGEYLVWQGWVEKYPDYVNMDEIIAVPAIAELTVGTEAPPIDDLIDAGAHMDDDLGILLKENVSTDPLFDIAFEQNCDHVTAAGVKNENLVQEHGHLQNTEAGSSQTTCLPQDHGYTKCPEAESTQAADLSQSSGLSVSKEDHDLTTTFRFKPTEDDISSLGASLCRPDDQNQIQPNQGLIPSLDAGECPSGQQEKSESKNKVTGKESVSPIECSQKHSNSFRSETEGPVTKVKTSPSIENQIPSPTCKGDGNGTVSSGQDSLHDEQESEELEDTENANEIKEQPSSEGAECNRETVNEAIAGVDDNAVEEGVERGQVGQRQVQYHQAVETTLRGVSENFGYSLLGPCSIAEAENQNNLNSLRVQMMHSYTSPSSTHSRADGSQPPENSRIVEAEDEPESRPNISPVRDHIADTSKGDRQTDPEAPCTTGCKETLVPSCKPQETESSQVTEGHSVDLGKDSSSQSPIDAELGGARGAETEAGCSVSCDDQWRALWDEHYMEIYWYYYNQFLGWYAPGAMDAQHNNTQSSWTPVNESSEQAEGFVNDCVIDENATPAELSTPFELQCQSELVDSLESRVNHSAWLRTEHISSEPHNDMDDSQNLKIDSLEGDFQTKINLNSSHNDSQSKTKLDFSENDFQTKTKLDSSEDDPQTRTRLGSSVENKTSVHTGGCLAVDGKTVGESGLSLSCCAHEDASLPPVQPAETSETINTGKLPETDEDSTLPSMTGELPDTCVGGELCDKDVPDDCAVLPELSQSFEEAGLDETLLEQELHKLNISHKDVNLLDHILTHFSVHDVDTLTSALERFSMEEIGQIMDNYREKKLREMRNEMQSSSEEDSDDDTEGESEDDDDEESDEKEAAGKVQISEKKMDANNSEEDDVKFGEEDDEKDNEKNDVGDKDGDEKEEEGKVDICEKDQETDKVGENVNEPIEHKRDEQGTNEDCLDSDTIRPADLASGSSESEGDGANDGPSDGGGSRNRRRKREKQQQSSDQQGK